MITGYKWTARKTDGKLFFVTLECNNEFVDTGEGRKLDKITFIQQIALYDGLKMKKEIQWKA